MKNLKTDFETRIFKISTMTAFLNLLLFPSTFKKVYQASEPVKARKMMKGGGAHGRSPPHAARGWYYNVVVAENCNYANQT